MGNINLSNVPDLSGLNATNRWYAGASFANTNITAAQLATARALTTPSGDMEFRKTDLRGTGITRAELEAALTATGRNPYEFPHSVFFNFDKILFDQ